MTFSNSVGPVRRVLIFVGAFEPGYKAGGPIKSIAELINSLPASIEATVVTSDRDLGDTGPYPGLSGRSVARGRHRVHYLNVRDLRQWSSLLNRIRRTKYDLLYLNSLWSPWFTAAPVILGIVHVIRHNQLLLAPRGELSEGALGIKPAKKRRALRCYRSILKVANPLWHASTELESQDITKRFPFARIVVQINSRGDGPILAPITPRVRVRFIFLSRICEKKNLLTVIRAALLVKNPQFDVDIYGPIEDHDYWAQCLRLMDRAPIGLRITYCGHVQPHVVQATFANYDAFILPSLGENFGHVIGESLSAGCPVVCSRYTPWTPVLEAGGGMALFDLSAIILAEELERRAKLSRDSRLGEKAEALKAYRKWQLLIPRSSVVETVLNGSGHEA